MRLGTSIKDFKKAVKEDEPAEKTEEKPEDKQPDDKQG